MTTNVPAGRPRRLWTAIVILYVQTVFNGGGGVLALALAAEETEHGRQAPELYVFGVVSVVIGIVMCAGAIALTHGVSWARVPIAVVESLGIVSGVIAVASGVVGNVVNIVLCVLVLVNLFHHDVTEWFATRRDRAGAAPWPGPPPPRSAAAGSAEWRGAPPDRDT